MGVRYENRWARVRDSLWFIPAVSTIVAAALAALTIAAEQQGWLTTRTPSPWIYGGGAEGARSVLSAINGSLITVTGVVFSVTIVAVQLASTQYTPRVLRNFTSDRGNQVVLGIFIGTFTYSVLVLRTVRSAAGLGEEFTPRLAVTTAIVLLLLSVGALIYFINHVASEIHVTTILDRIAKQTMGNVHQLFPEHIGRADDEPPPDPRLPEHASVPICSTRAGYLQMVDENALFQIGDRARIVVGMQPKIGDYVLQGRPLAAVWTEGELTLELEEAVRRAFILGPERMPQQDVEFGMIQMSDVAIKSLSPSVNDPTTAIRCIDRLAEILTELGSRNPPEPRRTRDGAVRFIASYTRFERAVTVSFSDIRHFGAAIPLIAEHLLQTLEVVAASVPAGRREPLLEEARAVLHTARAEITNPKDVEAIEVAARYLSKPEMSRSG